MSSAVVYRVGYLFWATSVMQFSTSCESLTGLLIFTALYLHSSSLPWALVLNNLRKSCRAGGNNFTRLWKENDWHGLGAIGQQLWQIYWIKRSTVDDSEKILTSTATQLNSLLKFFSQLMHGWNNCRHINSVRQSPLDEFLWSMNLMQIDEIAYGVGSSVPFPLL